MFLSSLCTKQVFIITSVVISSDYNEDSLSGDSRLTLALFRVKCSNTVHPIPWTETNKTDHRSGYRYLCYRLGSWDELVFLVLTEDWLPSNFWHSLACRNPQRLISVSRSGPFHIWTNLQTHLGLLCTSPPTFILNLRVELFLMPVKKHHLTELVSLFLLVCFLFSMYFTYIGDSKSYNIAPSRYHISKYKHLLSI